MRKISVEISKDMIKKLSEFSSLSPNEVCGVLIGKRKTSSLFLITEVVLDDSFLKSSKISITRNTKHLYPTVKDIVENSPFQKVDFIGDWHSHLGVRCEYSHTDYLTIQSMLQDPDYGFLKSIILIIVSPPNNLKVYLFKRSKKKPIQMGLIIVKK